MSSLFSAPATRILDFDCECRPLSWYGGDWVTKELTAIACKPVDGGRMKVWLLGVHDPVEMLEGFRKEYDKADIVTGHFIRGFDLPLLNMAMIDNGLPILGQKLTQDTKLDLVKFSGLSKSQENLGALFELKHPKIGMDQARWRAANRLQAEGIHFVKRRVTGDVRQHIELRRKLLEAGLLGPPKRWSPMPGNLKTYTP